MEWKKIESRANPAVKFAVSLSDKKFRDRQGVFLAEGLTLFFDFCKMGLLPRYVYLSEKAASLRAKVEDAFCSDQAELYLLSESAFEKVTAEKGSQGLVCVYSVSDVNKLCPLTRTHRLIALERVQDPGNVGTIIRTASAFGFDGVLLTDCADPFGPKTIRATMGAIAGIPIRSFPSTEELFVFLKEKGVRSVAACLAPDSKPIGKADLSQPVCILIGNEGKGLSDEALALCDEKAVIPMETMESLNAAAAATVFLWEVKRRGEHIEG
ncbi:MAG: RNA methyltransferase [Clostridia bacterium]|nr:RNA methyltransferase [Clostridia bacterium]